jgi:hypothetical protein
MKSGRTLSTYLLLRMHHIELMFLTFWDSCSPPLTCRKCHITHMYQVPMYDDVLGLFFELSKCTLPMYNKVSFITAGPPVTQDTWWDSRCSRFAFLYGNMVSFCFSLWKHTLRTWIRFPFHVHLIQGHKNQIFAFHSSVWCSSSTLFHLCYMASTCPTTR